MNGPSSTTLSFEKPRWLRDLLRFLPLKSQFVLSGNVRDLQASEVAPGIVTALPLDACLRDALRDAGFGHVLMWNPLTGFSVLDRPGEDPWLRIDRERIRPASARPSWPRPSPCC